MEASTMLGQLGDDAKLLAGGQSLIPLMKLRFANPAHLVDLNFVPGTSYVKEESGALRLGPLTRHAEIESSALASTIPILHDCAAGIADLQVRNRGTIGGSLAEADPSGDWATVLMTLSSQVRCLGPQSERMIPMSDFIEDAYTTALAHDEVVSEVLVKVPPKGSGGAYLAFKRCAPVYPSASAGVQLTIEEEACKQATIVLGCVGLTPVRATNAEQALQNKEITEQTITSAMEAARCSADPQSDMRGSADFKRGLIAALVKRAIQVARRRAGGENIEVSHIYA
jgi:aerobic carbon-monoxide dehydrogenase medium subunit